MVPAIPSAAQTSSSALAPGIDPVRFEVVRHALLAITEEMGATLRRDYTLPDHTPSFSILSDKTKYPPWGLFGGGLARPARYILNPDTPEARELPSKITWPLKPGDVVSVQTPGGGGCEAAWKRPTEQVVTEVALGKISAERAHQAYGVVLDPTTLTLDEAATAEARTLLVRQSLEKTDA